MLPCPHYQLWRLIQLDPVTPVFTADGLPQPSRAFCGRVGILTSHADLIVLPLSTLRRWPIQARSWLPTLSISRAGNLERSRKSSPLTSSSTTKINVSDIVGIGARAIQSCTPFQRASEGWSMSVMAIFRQLTGPSQFPSRQCRINTAARHAVRRACRTLEDLVHRRAHTEMQGLLRGARRFASLNICLALPLC